MFFVENYKILQRLPNFFGGGPSDPPPLYRDITYTFYKAKTIISNVFLPGKTILSVKLF